jgi:hypothetical protein
MNYDTIIRLFRWFIVPLDTHSKINDKNIKLRTKGNNPTSHQKINYNSETEYHCQYHLS